MTIAPDDLDYPLSNWCRVAHGAKAVFGWPDWVVPPLHRESATTARQAGRTRLLSSEAEICSLAVLLQDASQASIEGVRLLVNLWKHRPIDDATALLQVTYEGKFVSIARLDSNPAAAHPNKFWRRFDCPPMIEGSHVHAFEPNARIGRDAFDPNGNLPVAFPLDTNPASVREFFRVVGQAFHIEGLDALPMPPTQEGML